MELIYFVKSILNIETKIYFSSSFNIAGNKSDKILNICKEFNASEYIVGEGSRSYLDLKNSMKIK